MHRLIKLIVLNCAALSVLSLTAPAADDDGYTTLTGKDLSNFKTEGNWKVEDGGVLHLVPREGEKGWKRYGSYLWLKQQYADFSLDLEYFFFQEALGDTRFTELSNELEALR